jgi:hypothetical protein
VTACACGCGEEVEGSVNGTERKWVDESHRQRHARRRRQETIAAEWIARCRRLLSGRSRLIEEGGKVVIVDNVTGEIEVEVGKVLPDTPAKRLDQSTIDHLSKPKPSVIGSPPAIPEAPGV